MERHVIVDRGALCRMASTLGRKVDFKKLRAALGGHGHMLVSSKEPGIEQGTVLAALQADWSVHQFDPMPGPDGRPRAYPEVNMALLATDIMGTCAEEVVLVTGANAAAPIATHLRRGGVRVTIASFRGSLGGELRRNASVEADGTVNVIYLDEEDVFHVV